jgi:hypothetical protein
MARNKVIYFFKCLGCGENKMRKDKEGIGKMLSGCVPLKPLGLASVNHSSEGAQNYHNIYFIMTI